MQANELLGFGKRASRALSVGTNRIGELHANIAARLFRAVGPMAGPVQVLHDGVSGAAFGTVREGPHIGRR